MNTDTKGNLTNISTTHCAMVGLCKTKNLNKKVEKKFCS